MSEQQTPDERFVAERLQAAAGARAISPNPEAVVHRGRRLRRRHSFALRGLALGVVAGLALGAMQVKFAHADRKDVVVAVPAEVAWPTGSVYADRDAVCTYNEKTLAQRTLAFDGTIRTIESSTGGAAELDVHRWYVGGSGGIFNVDFPKLDDAGRKLEPGMRVLVSGMKDSGPGSPPVVWTCGFTRYWSQADAAVWDRVFAGQLGSSAARSGTWCTTDRTVVEANQEWRSTPGAQEATRQTDAVLADLFGVDTKQDTHAQLAAGVIGVGGDAAREELVVVVDPTQVSIEALERKLYSRLDASKDPAPVVVRASCRSAADLVRAHQVLTGRGWHPDSGKISFGFHLDEYSSSWAVTMPEGTAADALAHQLGDLVRITYGYAGRN